MTRSVNAITAEYQLIHVNRRELHAATREGKYKMVLRATRGGGWEIVDYADGLFTGLRYLGLISLRAACDTFADAISLAAADGINLKIVEE